MTAATLNPSGTVQHRPAQEPRRKPRGRGKAPKDEVDALDMFSGVGGSSQGLEAAGVRVWYAANHWEYAVEIHEANHPGAEHFIADLLDTTATDYYHPEHLPAATMLWASPSCTNHSKANSQRAYRRNASLFDTHDEDYEERVTASERSRATAVCVLQYMRKHHPKVAVVENVVEFANWGPAIGHSSKGDGTTFQWWIKEIAKLGYEYKILFLNSMFFPPCPQSRDRMYVVMWDRKCRAPDLEHRPNAWCQKCGEIVKAQQAFKRRTGAWPLAQWGKYEDQYIYICQRCTQRVLPEAWPCASVIDWSDLGERIGDKTKPLADSTMARIARGVEKFAQWPSFVMPAKNMERGVDRHVTEPFQTQTGQQELMIVNAMQVVVAGNTHEREGSSCRTRSVAEPMWAQHATEAFGVVAAPPSWIVANRTNNVPTSTGEPCPPFATGNSHLLISRPFLDSFTGEPRGVGDPLPTQAGHETQGLVHLPFMIKNNGNEGEAGYRAYPIDEPFGTFVAGGVTQGLVAVPLLYTDRGTSNADGSLRAGRVESVGDPMTTVAASGNHHFMVTPLFAKQNGGPADTAWHQVSEPFNTLLGVDTTCFLAPPVGEMPPIAVEDCLYRMLKPDEIKLGMGLDWGFKMWGTARQRVKGLGNAVTPPVSEWICKQLLEVLK